VPPQFQKKGEPKPSFSANVFCKTGEGGGVDPSCGKEKGGKGPKVKMVDAIIERLRGSESEVRGKQFTRGFCGNIARTLSQMLPGSKTYGLIATVGKKKHLLHVVTKYQGKFIDAQGEVDPKSWSKEKYNSSGNKLPGKITKLAFETVSLVKTNDPEFGSAIDWGKKGVRGSADSSRDSELTEYLKTTLKGLSLK
jgi:hypothetical protein